jgi:hypothetical protein
MSDRINEDKLYMNYFCNETMINEKDS